VLKFTPVACDVSSEESVQKAFSAVIKEYKKLDAVVASAGIVENYPALE
jgi:NAD(P)-dependent dehydrogenase (short-subunit alcohol dehydrogenase family)